MRYSSAFVPQDPITSGMNNGLNFYNTLLKAVMAPQQAALNNQDIQSQIALRNAQTAKLNGNAAYQYQSPTGKLFSDSETIKKIFGEDSPQSKSFQDQVAAELKKQQVMTDFYDSLTKSAPYRYSPNVVKEQITGGGESAGLTPEQAQILATRGGMGLDANGGGPGMNAGAPGLSQSPQDQQRAAQAADQIKSAIIKSTTDPDDLKKIRAGNRADITEENLDQFIQAGALDYNGLTGKADLEQDKLLSMILGKTPPKLQAYQNLQGQLALWEDEYANTVGIPADQESRNKFHQLFDIKSLSKDPRAASAQIQNIKALLGKTEGVNRLSLSQAFQNHQKIEDAFKDNKPSGLTVNPDKLNSAVLNNPAIAKQAGISSSQKYVGSDGKTYTQEELEQIVARGG